MGHISSKIQAIDQQRFEPPPKKAFKPVKVYATHRSIFALMESGVIYTDHSINRKIFVCGTGSDDAAVQAMVGLGVITEEQAWEHGESARARDQIRNMIDAVGESIENLERAGIKLTPQQRRQLTRMRNELKRMDADDWRVPHWLRDEFEHLRTQGEKKP